MIRTYNATDTTLKISESNVRKSAKFLTFSLIQDQVGSVMRKCGVSVMTTSICNIAAFTAAAIIPIPAMRSFCFQVYITVNLLQLL